MEFLSFIMTLYFIGMILLKDSLFGTRRRCSDFLYFILIFMQRELRPKKCVDSLNVTTFVRFFLFSLIVQGCGSGVLKCLYKTEYTTRASAN